jgi:phage-related protein
LCKKKYEITLLASSALAAPTFGGLFGAIDNIVHKKIDHVVNAVHTVTDATHKHIEHKIEIIGAVGDSVHDHVEKKINTVNEVVHEVENEIKVMETMMNANYIKNLEL